MVDLLEQDPGRDCVQHRPMVIDYVAHDRRTIGFNQYWSITKIPLRIYYYRVDHIGVGPRGDLLLAYIQDFYWKRADHHSDPCGTRPGRINGLVP